jgi:hypothetical protein
MHEVIVLDIVVFWRDSCKAPVLNDYFYQLFFHFFNQSIQPPSFQHRITSYHNGCGGFDCGVARCDGG